MGRFGTALRGRTKAAAWDPADLFALNDAMPVLQAATRLRPTGVGSICLKPLPEADLAAVQDALGRPRDVAGAAKYEQTTDTFSHTWLTRRAAPDRIGDLTADLGEVSATIEGAGRGGALLCALVVLTDRHRPAVGLVYRYSRRAWYPFAPTGDGSRDNARELELRGHLEGGLNVEQDLGRWYPVWGAPGL